MSRRYTGIGAVVMAVLFLSLLSVENAQVQDLVSSLGSFGATQGHAPVDIADSNAADVEVLPKDDNAAGVCFPSLRYKGYSRCLPSFIVAGVQKGGTSELSDWLSVHPGLVRMRGIEVHFFDCIQGAPGSQRGICKHGPRQRWNKKSGGKALLSYMRLIPEQPDNKKRLVVYEKTPSYFDGSNPHVVASMLQGLKVVISVRNPASRFYSAYWHSCRMTRSMPLCSIAEIAGIVNKIAHATHGLDCTDPEQSNAVAVLQQHDQPVSKREKQLAKWAVRAFEMGKYFRFLDRWDAAVSSDNIFLIHLEAFKANPLSVMDKLETFLDIPHATSEYKASSHLTHTGEGDILKIGKVFSVHNYPSAPNELIGRLDNMYESCTMKLCNHTLVHESNAPNWIKRPCGW